jgi:hypothetical protein
MTSAVETPRDGAKAAAYVASTLADALLRTPDAQRFQERLLNLCSVRLIDILDHLVQPGDDDAFVEAGWLAVAPGLWRHPSGAFPDIIAAGAPGVAFRVECIDAFLKATGIVAAVEGARHGQFRHAKVFASAAAGFTAVERHGWSGYDQPGGGERKRRRARLHQQIFRSRRRQFRDAEGGFAHVERLVDAAVADLGAAWACDLFMRAEREFWASRCDAGQVQSRRQVHAGVGWSNFDHGACYSSREHVHTAARILGKLGCRDAKLFVGDDGVGAMTFRMSEGPAMLLEADLAAHEDAFDDRCQSLSPLTWHRRAGLWCALHGESLLEGGFARVAGRYDQALLRRRLAHDGIETISMATRDARLRQELAPGGLRAVNPIRVTHLQRAGYLSRARSDDLRLSGAVATHLQSVQRTAGCQAFEPAGAGEQDAEQAQDEPAPRRPIRSRILGRRLRAEVDL